MKRAWMFVLVSALLLITAPVRAAQMSAIDVRLVLKVDDREKAAEQLVSRVILKEGYFLEKSRSRVTFKVPVAGLKAVVAAARELGQVIDHRLEREDLGQYLLEMQATLKAKSDMQRQYWDLLDQADARATLTLEKELIQLAAEIESLKGRLRLLDHRRTFARVTVDFEYRDRSAPAPSGESSFAWLNTMNLTDLLEDF